MTQLTAEQIRQAVIEALQEAKAQHISDRLLPFTAAEIKFIQDVVTGALSKVLLKDTST